MLIFRHINFTAVVALLILSVSAFANTGQDDQRDLSAGKAHSEKSGPNLVELYKVKTHATEHIRGLEVKLLATDEADQEELLVELAQSLLYYQNRHNKASDAKAAISKEVSSLSANEANGKVSKVANSKGLFATNNIYRKALNAYKKASQLSLNKNRIKYTRKLSELTVSLNNKNELVQMFDELLQHGGDEKGTYLAHIDYADGLAKFKDYSADAQFLSAINMRTPVDGIEANFRYANYLLDKNKPREALYLLDKFTFEERRIYVHIALLRQNIMHHLKMNTEEVDAEIKQIRKNLGNSPFIAGIPKLSEIAQGKLANLLNLTKAYAYRFAHNNELDDSRGKYSNSWIIAPTFLGYIFSTSVINTSEIVYNEARGKKLQGRYAVAWAIRNRATIDMNGCGFYPGAESDPRIGACRAATPDGPSNQFPEYIDTFKRYSCVVHGGTTSVGATHSEMNDEHVSIENLYNSGVIFEMIGVINGWVHDPTGPHFFLTGVYPYKNLYTGNPSGAQEWMNANYCAANYSCKVRLGNVGGEWSDSGDVCSDKRLQSTLNTELTSDNFFWGRKAKLNGVLMDR